MKAVTIAKFLTRTKAPTVVHGEERSGEERREDEEERKRRGSGGMLSVVRNGREHEAFTLAWE